MRVTDRVKMGLGEEIIREYPLHKTSESLKTESAYLTVTNKRIIYTKSSSEKRRRTRELRDIPLTSVDSVESLLKEEKYYSPLAIFSAVLFLVAGILLVALESFWFGIALVAIGALILLLTLLLTRPEYHFYLSIGTLGKGEINHLNFGASAISARSARKRTSHPIGIAINGSEIDKLISELGAIIIRFKSGATF